MGYSDTRDPPVRQTRLKYPGANSSTAAGPTSDLLKIEASEVS